MTKKTRLMVLAGFAALFLLTVPYIVADSLGYRVDFGHFKFTATGGIYIKAMPQGANITIDSDVHETTNILSPTVFTQNLLPGNHNVTIKKEGYFDYTKTIPVRGNEVTKLEHVSLIKRNIPFTLLASNVTDSSKITSTTWSADSSKALLQAGISYFLLEPTLSTPKITPLPYLLGATDVHFNPKDSNEIFYIKNENFYINDGKTNKKISSETFPADNKNIISPDGQKILYQGDHELSYSLNSENAEKIFLNRFSEKIGQAYWLGNDYIIFTLGPNIVISEIDIRGNTNMVTLPGSATLDNNGLVNIENPNIYLSQPEKKLYIFTKTNLIVSERLIP